MSGLLVPSNRSGYGEVFWGAKVVFQTRRVGFIVFLPCHVSYNLYSFAETNKIHHQKHTLLNVCFVNLSPLSPTLDSFAV